MTRQGVETSAVTIDESERTNAVLAPSSVDEHRLVGPQKVSTSVPLQVLVLWIAVQDCSHNCQQCTQNKHATDTAYLRDRSAHTTLRHAVEEDLEHGA